MKLEAASCLCLLLYAGCLTDEDDPATETDESAIIENSLAGPQDLLGVVNVLSQGSFCSGELISSNTVLTAAHCVCDGTSCQPSATVRFRLEPSTGRPWAPDNAGMTGRVRVHPLYTGNRAYDIATITLDASAPGFASPFTVASTQPSGGSRIMIAGFGDSGPGCGDKRSHFPSLWWDNTRFDRYYNYHPGVPLMQWDDEVWCHGDSGGPALVDNGTLNPTVVAGVFSGFIHYTWWGTINVATPTGYHYPWIKSAVCTSSAQNRCTASSSLCGCTASTDLLWRNQSTGDFAIWAMDGNVATSTPTVQPGIPLEWQIVGSGDFDGDRQADVLWRFHNNINSQTKIWRMVGTSHVSSTQLSDPGLTSFVAAVADFDGNGRADILWHNTAFGHLWLWRNGDPTTASRVSWQNLGGAIEATWLVKGAGDFNGDGKADIFWERNDGQTAIWLMNGATWIGEEYFGPRGGGFEFKGIGDFNGDARSDVLWRGINGQLKIWFNGGGVRDANGAVRSTAVNGPSWHNQYVTVPSSTTIQPAPTSTEWNIDRIADFNRDGRDDLLWRSGNWMAIWYLDGTRFIGESDPRMPGETGHHWFDAAWQTTGVSRQPNF